MHSRHVVKSAALMAVSAVLLFGCDWYPVKSKNGEYSDMQDRQQELTRQDYRDMNKLKKLLPDDAQTDADLGAPPIPDLAQVLAAPRPPKIANTKLVTLSVTDDVPLRDVLFELGRLANVDIEVGGGLDSQGINLRATDRPFNEVIERIADLGGLRYSVNGNSIRVERDLPYIKNYSLDFINTVRSSQSSYTLSTSILSGSGGGGGGAGGGGGGGAAGGGGAGGGSGVTGGSVGTSGSSSSISSSSESDLWAALESSVTEILNYYPQGGSAAPGGAALSSDSATPAAGGPAATGAAIAAGAAGQAAGAGGLQSAGFVINRQAGILSVNATERQHEMIDRFLTLLKRNSSAQVLIEAKIVEVSLTDEFASGVDWNSLWGNLDGVFAAPGSYAPQGTGLDFSNGADVFGLSTGNLDVLVRLTERFGTTRTLSSPRLSAINNQQAVLTFARNVVFFDCTVEPPTTTTTDTSTSDSAGSADCSASSVPIGIILNILPSINVDSQEVTLSVRPTLTRQVGEEENPEGRLIAAITPSSTLPVIRTFVPIIEVREIDSIMKVKSGGVMVIGGLMEDNSETANTGTPGVSDLPIIGSAFKSRQESYGKRELIIFIKATIVNTDGSHGSVDRSVVDRFTTDPRPLFPPKKFDAQ